MKKDLKKYAMALYESTQGKSGKELEKQIQGFVGLLARRRLLSRSPKIVELFVNYYNQAEGIVPVTVDTAHKLSPSELSGLSSQMEDFLKKKIELVNKTNDKLIGGMVIKVGNTIIDGSVKNYLNNFKSQLLK